MNRFEKNYDEMTREELEQELREAFLDTDIIDDPLNDELERMRETLNRKWPLEYPYTPEESWAHFLEDDAEELGVRLVPQEEPEAGKNKSRTAHSRSLPALLRRALIAAAAVVLLAGAALAADSLGLAAWVPGWNAFTGRYEPAAQEAAEVSPIPATLARLGISEPLYPAHLPEGFMITESHISEDPLVLMEQYAKEDKQFSITITPIQGFKTVVYQKTGEPAQEYYSGGAVHYIFAREGTITSVRYNDNYVTIVSGSIALEEIKSTIDSLSTVKS